MSRKAAINPLSVALGTVFTVSLANSTITSAAENPFSMQPVNSGYMVLAEGKCGEGKCGAGKGKGREGMCGMERMDTDGDGKVSKDEFMKGHEAKFEQIDQNSDGVIDKAEHDAHMKKMMGFMKEGKCGEGKCGGSKK
ncbi:putative low-complexity protein [Thiogranum longum]|uniref:Putative low-complexity protein n=1 Tax=Thiogranum longum TaxID=1537524 RepID=A0A4R1H8S2_9GAMM|nr:hypothetical protein [Thiogranum longum]TCK18234.1 putative low-complexity protein [Thiogranum longum]